MIMRKFISLMSKGEILWNNLLRDQGENGEADNPLVFYGPKVGAVLVIFLLALVGFLFLDSRAERQLNETNEIIYQFKAGPWKQYLRKEIDEQGILKELKFIQAEVGKDKSFAVLALEVATSFHKEKRHDRTIELISPLLDLFKGDKYLFSLLGSSLAVAYEDLGKRREAILLLEEILQRDGTFLEVKIHFDLARLYRWEGNMEKSQRHFHDIMEKFPGDRLATIARIYFKK